MSYKFFKSEYTPTGLTEKVGGNITSVELSGYLGELFPHQYAYPIESTGAVIQYRKLFIKNTYTSSSTETKIWLDAQHVSNQIAVAVQVNQSGTGNYQNPPSGLNGWYYPTTYGNGVSLGTLAPNASTGIWLRQTLSGVETSNPYTSLRLYVGGVVE